MKTKLKKTLGTREVVISAVALVVAASTLVSDFQGYFSFGIYFLLAILAAFGVNLLLGISSADLSVSYPEAGGLYHFSRRIFRNSFGKWLGTFIGITFFITLAFVMAGETQAGAQALKEMTGLDQPLMVFILLLATLALIPNLLGVKTAAWASAALLVCMLGIRWLFGVAGFFGVAQSGAWEFANLFPSSNEIVLFGQEGLLTTGFTLAFWGFIGIEFAAYLAEDVKAPSRTLPRSIFIGLSIILITSLIMGIGVTGTLPLSEWQQLTQGETGCKGDCPQMIVGSLFFGESGRLMMGLASVSATLGSLTVGFAAISRLLFSMGRDKVVLGPISGHLEKLNKKYQTPVYALFAFFLILVVVSFMGEGVIDMIFSAVYIWLILYIVFHIFSFINRVHNPVSIKLYPGNKFIYLPIIGFITTLFTIYVAFIGGHGYYGLRALLVLSIALMITLLSYLLQTRKHYLRRVLFRHTLLGRNA